ncbi:MAG: bifunctional (p)ppGpp synthetase/guanosine-3',5'-bis(diphosphate) 3'-pyrophosphohydrolase, partial [Synergistes sp.]|nr:bifunctional (p)ppGpp synthetase/guanosine-3',5'-bis(diphosphate) 3'-pyrophosphohydrolase [Synergistes sp.]
SHKREKQLTIARETIEIYAPLAHRLGIYNVKRELEDLSFRMLDPEMYYDIKRRVRKKLPEREAIIKEALDVLEARLKEEKITDVQVKGRPKHFYSIYEKMRRKNLALEQLYDLLALRVIVNTVAECYQVLGLVHTIWKPIPGQFDDYIANPKNNMYQSLHTTVVGPQGEPLEVQIRTKEMNLYAEYGIAAHWNYKEGGHKIDSLDEKLTWIRKALETAPEPGEANATESGSEVQPDSKLFLENLKTDILTTDVFVFTPQGKIVRIPQGSTSIDFAYAVHTEVGHKCVGTMINGRIAPMDQKLQNGDIVRILTSPQGKPSRDWLKIAKSSRTRSKIKSWFRQQEKQERDEKMKRGVELLEKEAVRRYPNEEKPLEAINSKLSFIAREMGYASLDELIIAVGSGNHSASSILGRVSAEGEKRAEAAQEAAAAQLRKEPDSEIVVEGVQGVLVTLAQCCRPIPGDAIEGVVTQAHGISVHRKDCPNLIKSSRSKRVAVSWGKLKESRYTARISAVGAEKPTLLADIVQVISSLDGQITNVKGHVVNNTRTHVTADVRVRNLEHLYLIIAKLNNISGMVEVTRE